MDTCICFPISKHPYSRWIDNRNSFFIFSIKTGPAFCAKIATNKPDINCDVYYGLFSFSGSFKGAISSDEIELSSSRNSLKCRKIVPVLISLLGGVCRTETPGARVRRTATCQLIKLGAKWSPLLKEYK